MENKWIKCSEKMPELCDLSAMDGNSCTINVLCTNNIAEVWVASFDYDTFEWFSEPSIINEKHFVPTHWMYIPKLPYELKEIKNEDN